MFFNQINYSRKAESIEMHHSHSLWILGKQNLETRGPVRVNVLEGKTSEVGTIVVSVISRGIEICSDHFQNHI